MSSSSSSIAKNESETETEIVTKMSSGSPIITFEDIAKYPGRAFLSRAGAPTKIVFGPDNDDKDDDGGSDETSLIYLGSDGNTLTQKLWKRTIQLSTDTEDIISELAKPPDGVGEEDTLSAEEKLRRERTRQLETGITNFEYSGNKKVLLCPIGNDLFIKHSDTKEEDDLIQIVDSSNLPGSVIDPHISYDGSIVIFVCNNELYSVSTITGVESLKQLTFDARGDDRDGIVNGLADFIAMEGTYIRAYYKHKYYVSFLFCCFVLLRVTLVSE
jgi:dipeptidyl-peptidase-4